MWTAQLVLELVSNLSLDDADLNDLSQLRRRLEDMNAIIEKITAERPINNYVVKL
jgi:hypothetical protein